MKKKITPILFTVFCLAGMLFCQASYAQQTVTGKVVNTSDGTPIVGASIQLKGTTQGTTSGPTGSFSLTVPNSKGSVVLDISYIGYASQEIDLNGRSSVDVSLSESSGSLNEIVITGYQAEKKKDITGAVGVVDAKELNAIPQGNAAQQIQGRVSGVTVLSSGQPGEGVQLRIRGFSTFGDNNPLYIIDGVRGNINSIDPNDIESISILKDAGSASIYGVEAANGVVVITTKKGTPGKMRVEYDASYGTQMPGDGYKMLTPTEEANWTWTAMKNAGETPSNVQYGTGATPVVPDYLKAGNNYGLPASSPLVAAALYDGGTNLNASGNGDLNYQIIKANQAGTDWYKAVTRNAPITNHSLSMSGGTQDAQYNIALGYFDQTGIVLATYQKKYTLRANTEFNIANRVKIGENLQVLYGQNPMITNGNEGNAISYAYRENPLIPVYDIKGNFAGTAAKGFNNPENPVADQVRAEDNTDNNDDIFGDIYAEIRLPFYLTFRSTLGADYGSYYYNSFGYRQYENAENNLTNTVYEGGGYNESWQFTNQLTFDHTYGQHHLNVFVGEEAIDESLGDQINGSGINPFSWQLKYRTLNTTQSSGRSLSDNPFSGPYIFSVFGKINYDYAEKYLVSFTIRRDGSSVFGANDKYGVFPAATVGWRISQENFLKSVTWLNDLKLRGSYGETGNAKNVPNNNQYKLYAPNTQTASYDISGSNSSLSEGIAQTQLANPNGHWETDKETNIGFDATLFNNSLTITADFYQRKTTDLLFQVPVEHTVGLANVPDVNIGSMSNNGIDLLIEKRGTIAKDWNYDLTLNLTTYHNNVDFLAPGVNYFDGYSYGSGRLGNTVTRNAVGHPMSAFFGYKVIGLWQNQSEINAADAEAQKVTGNPAATFQSGGEHPGEFRYADVNNDGQISDADRTFIGNPNPSVTYGLNLQVSYKNWDLIAFFYGSVGNDIYNYVRWWTDFYPGFAGAGIGADVRKSWTPSNTNTNFPIFEDRGTFSTNQVNNSFYVEKGSYLRLKNLEIGYTFTKGSLSKAGIDHLRIYLQGLNLFTATKYSGLDPEISGVTGGSTYDTNFGVDYGNYPNVKQLLVGINLGF